MLNDLGEMLNHSQEMLNDLREILDVLQKTSERYSSQPLLLRYTSLRFAILMTVTIRTAS